MPTVLVSGITSFVSTHVALVFLRSGWSVRGTLRSESRRTAIIDNPALGPYVVSGKLSLYITGDLASADWSPALAGCDAVAHVATPVEFASMDFKKDYLDPAVNGTRDLLEATAKIPTINAVVITSTYGAAGDHREPANKQKGLVIDENSWNPYTIEELIAIGEASDHSKLPFAPGGLFYMGAKKYAELAGWEIQKATGAKYSLATINPVVILGPPENSVSSLTSGGISIPYQYALLAGKDAGPHPMGGEFPWMVDVRDVAEAHYQAVVRHAQGRFLLSNQVYDFQYLTDRLRILRPDLDERIPLGTPGKYEFESPGVYTVKNEKSIRDLGIKYHTLDQTIIDGVDKILQLEAALQNKT